MENELKFPVINGEMPPPSLRTIDEIDAWIEEDYASFFNREVYEREKRLFSVNVPFVLTTLSVGESGDENKGNPKCYGT